jgi:anthranilate phosphoribosyltransferase
MIFNQLMSHQFRELLKKVGSGQHTKKDLTRAEAAIATKMMLTQEATPAQIGAFMIAHRIKRPTGSEIAGMLDAYDELGTKIPSIPSFNHPITVLGVPYDGRSRFAPINPLTALILACVDIPVILHGGDRIPTKYGLPLMEIFQGLGIDFAHLSLAKIEQIFAKTYLGFYYIRNHFPLAQNLMPYRDEIGKRPPFSTIELVWNPYQGEINLITGYVHPPTEKMIRDAFLAREFKNFTLIKGLEGSPDLRLSQTTIVVVNKTEKNAEVEYLKLHPEEYNLREQDVPLLSLNTYLAQVESVLKGQDSPLIKATIWNGGFYLWHCGICHDLAEGLKLAETLISQGQLHAKREEIKNLIINN